MEVNEKEKIKNVIIMLLLVVIILLSCGIIYVYNHNSQLDTERKKQNTLEEVYLTEEEANELISYIPSARPYGGDGRTETTNMYYTAFSNKKVSVSEMDVNWLVHNTLFEMQGKNIQKNPLPVPDSYRFCSSYNISELKDNLEKKYGKEIKNLELPEKIEGDFLTEFEKWDEYYIMNCPNGGYALSDLGLYFGIGGGKSNLIIKYEKSKKDRTNLYVYIKFLKADFVKPDMNISESVDEYESKISFQLYKYGDSKELITDTVFNAKDYYEKNSTKSFEDSIYEQFKDEMTTYKITYQQDGAHYTLASVEPITE